MYNEDKLAPTTVSLFVGTLRGETCWFFQDGIYVWFDHELVDYQIYALLCKVCDEVCVIQMYSVYHLFSYIWLLFGRHRKTLPSAISYEGLQ